MDGLQYISCIRFSMQLIIAELFFVIHWQKRPHFALRLLASACGYVISSYLVFQLFSLIPGSHPIAYVLYYFSLFFLTLSAMRFCLEAKGKDILFAGVCAYATQHIAFAIYMIFLQVTGISLPVLPDFLLLRLLPYVLVSAAVYFFIIKKYEGKGELRDKDPHMILIALVILFTVIVVSVYVDDRNIRENVAVIRNILCRIYAILCCVLAIFIAFNLSRQNRMLKEKELMENMLHNLREQQKLSQENINIINIKCHDLKYRISKISRIEDAEDQKEYIESIKNAISIYDNIYQTGNDALDLVLTEKSLRCNEHHVKLSTMVDGSTLHFMNSTDVYALFGNLLDNAIESVMAQEDEERRIISALVTKREQGCHIHIENYCNAQLQFVDGLPLTTKKDKCYHGFGVKSIKYIVDKYKGDVFMQMRDRKFMVDILFYV